MTAIFTMDIVGTIASVVDLSGKIIVYLQDLKGGKEERTKLLTEVVELKALLPILQHRAKDSLGIVDALSIPLQRCRAALVHLESRLKTAERRERKLIWPFTRREI